MPDTSLNLFINWSSKLPFLFRKNMSKVLLAGEASRVVSMRVGRPQSLLLQRLHCKDKS